jgi:molecular chaperone DnaK
MQDRRAVNPNFHHVIGIDLGTTYSGVATWNRHEEKTEMIISRSEAYRVKIPSVVSLDPYSGKALVGDWAKQNYSADMENTIIEIKREMGELFTMELLNRYKAEKVFNVGEPVKVWFKGRWIMPQEASALILMRMKGIAEDEIGTEIHDAVVTVPAYFDQKRRKATREAALLAGLYPRDIIDEPTAAAVCYGVDLQEGGRNTYMVYDLGGGTLDVSIIEVEGRKINVIATTGATRLGGVDFDNAITGWTLAEILRLYRLDLHNDPVAKAKIKYAAEQTKILLSNADMANIVLPNAAEHGMPATLTIERARPGEELLTKGRTSPMTFEEIVAYNNSPNYKRPLTFEELINVYLEKSLGFVVDAINQAVQGKGKSPDDINAVLLVGGSSRIPRVKRMLIDHFRKGEDFITDHGDPDAVVARGAALIAKDYQPTAYAFDIRRQPDESALAIEGDDALQIHRITAHTLGVRTHPDKFHKLVPRGTNTPFVKAQDGFVNAGSSNEILVEVYQGEGDFYYQCAKIGELHIIPIEPKPPGSHNFEITFRMDDNGLLSTTVRHLNTGKDFNAEFKDITTAGGIEVLEIMRMRLLELYGGAKPPQPPPPPPGVPQQPYRQAPPYAPPLAPPGQFDQPPPYPPFRQPAQPALQLIQPAVEVPEQFKSVVRRAQRLLARGIYPELAETYNAFINALNSGKTGPDLDDLRDELEDVYQDSR